MTKHELNLIDMTPLLDVVFILLFALILNVNVSKAEEAALREAQVKVIEEQSQTIDDANATIQLQEDRILQSGGDMQDVLGQLDYLMEDNLSLSEALKTSQDLVRNKEALLDAYEAALEGVLEREVSLSDEGIQEQWLLSIQEGDMLLEEWLKKEQIAERYLFVDLRVSSLDGRIYLDELYTGINISLDTIKDQTLRQETRQALQFYLYDWLDHKEGGYSFVFVSVVSDASVTRAVIETIFDSLQGLQIAFDKDQYLINRYVRYE